MHLVFFACRKRPTFYMPFQETSKVVAPSKSVPGISVSRIHISNMLRKMSSRYYFLYCHTIKVKSIYRLSEDLINDNNWKVWYDCVTLEHTLESLEWFRVSYIWRILVHSSYRTDDSRGNLKTRYNMKQFVSSNWIKYLWEVNKIRLFSSFNIWIFSLLIWLRRNIRRNIGRSIDRPIVNSFWICLKIGSA